MAKKSKFKALILNLQFDEKGLCYASPLTREIPPLPTYEVACQMPSPADLLARRETMRKEPAKDIEGTSERGSGKRAVMVVEMERV